MTSEEYWSVDVPGLTFERAVRLREFLMPDSPLGAVLLDPSKFMVRGFDRPTVELMVKCLQAVSPAMSMGPP